MSFRRNNKLLNSCNDNNNNNDTTIVFTSVIESTNYIRIVGNTGPTGNGIYFPDGSFIYSAYGIIGG